MRFTTQLSAVALGSMLATGAMAQATVKDDGVWRSAFTAAAAVATGNVKSTTINLLGDAVKATKEDKLRVYGTVMQGRVAGDKTADLWRLGTRYDYNLNPVIFGFGLGEVEKNWAANLSSRATLGGGLGYHVIKEANTVFDVYAGLTYTSDRFDNATIVDGATRSSYSYLSALLGEESTHKLSPTTTFKQSLVLYPNLKNTGEFRAAFDAGLSVAMSANMNLTVGLAHRYNSDPGTGLKKGDTLLTTGVTLKYE